VNHPIKTATLGANRREQETGEKYKPGVLLLSPRTKKCVGVSLVDDPAVAAQQLKYCRGFFLQHCPLLLLLPLSGSCCLTTARTVGVARTLVVRAPTIFSTVVPAVPIITGGRVLLACAARILASGVVLLLLLALPAAYAADLLRHIRLPAWGPRAPHDREPDDHGVATMREDAQEKGTGDEEDTHHQETGNENMSG